MLLQHIQKLFYQVGHSSALRLFAVVALYYASLYFSPRNLVTLLFTVLFCFAVWRVTKKLSLTFFIVCISTLIFPKGTAFERELIPLADIEHWALYSARYFFPIYISDIFLALLCATYLRVKLRGGTTGIPLSSPHVAAGIVFFFTCWVVISGSLSVFSEVGILSGLQLIRMLVLLYSPYIVGDVRKSVRALRIIAVASLLFEAIWVILQRFHGGPLGRDIEVYLPGARLGIRSSEDENVMRMAGTFFEPSILGTFLLMQISVMVPNIISFFSRQTRRSTVFLIAAAMGSIALVFTGSRMIYAIWILIAAGVYKMLHSYGVFRRPVRMHISWKLMVVLVATAVALLPYLITRLMSLAQVFTLYGSANYRLQMILYALRIAVENPILGVGINLSPYYFASGFSGERYVFDPTYPHNIFMQLIAETGMVGLGLFLLLAAWLLHLLGKHAQQRAINGFDIAVVTYLLCAQFYPIFLNHTELSSLFFLYAGVASYVDAKHHDT